LALADIQEHKLKGELLDFRQGLCFLKNVKIDADKDLKVTAHSKIVIITAGSRQKPNESRLSLVQRNTELLKSIS
jgi:L-lactate dehydrogenase